MIYVNKFDGCVNGSSHFLNGRLTFAIQALGLNVNDQGRAVGAEIIGD